MGRIRKTANIAAILKRTNYRLLHSTCSPDVRRGFAAVLESILLDSGLYAGFGYTTRSELDAVKLYSEKPGIEYKRPGGLQQNGDYHHGGREITAGEYFEELSAARNNGRKPRFSQTFPDESRRHYYVHSAIHSDYRKLSDDEIPTS